MRRPSLTDGVRQKLLSTCAFLAEARLKLGPDQFTDKDVVDSIAWITKLVQADKPGGKRCKEN